MRYSERKRSDNDGYGYDRSTIRWYDAEKLSLSHAHFEQEAVTRVCFRFNDLCTHHCDPTTATMMCTKRVADKKI